MSASANVVSNMTLSVNVTVEQECIISELFNHVIFYDASYVVVS